MHDYNSYVIILFPVQYVVLKSIRILIMVEIITESEAGQIMQVSAFNETYLNECKQQAATKFKHIVLCSIATFNKGNDRVILQDFFSLLHVFPVSQQRFNIYSMFPRTCTTNCV